MLEPFGGMSSSIVHLNVGGKKFSTTIGTLTKDSDSMLAKMVDEYWDLKKVKSGQALFIDRDPCVFDYILNYLRDDLSHVILPSESEKLRRLRVEADFYQLNELKRTLNRKIRDLESDSKPWIPKVGDQVRWADHALDSYSILFDGFVNGLYVASCDNNSVMVRRQTIGWSDGHPASGAGFKRFHIIDTGSVYEIEAREFNCFICDDLSHFKIVRKSFTKDKDWEDHSEDEQIHYKASKSKFLMSTAIGELEEILPPPQPNGGDASGTQGSASTMVSSTPPTCGLVRWTETQPVFTTVFFNERGVQKCKTKTARMHVPLRALAKKGI